MLSNFQIFPFKYYRYDIAANTYSLSEAYSFYVGPIPQFFLHPFINLVIFNFLFVKIVFYFPNILQIYFFYFYEYFGNAQLSLSFLYQEINKK